MLLKLILFVTGLSFMMVWLADGFKSYLREWERKLLQANFHDRINKEKYLEEVGYNVMNDPW